MHVKESLRAFYFFSVAGICASLFFFYGFTCLYIPHFFIQFMRFYISKTVYVQTRSALISFNQGREWWCLSKQRKKKRTCYFFIILDTESSFSRTALSMLCTPPKLLVCPRVEIICLATFLGSCRVRPTTEAREWISIFPKVLKHLFKSSVDCT